MNDRAYSDGIHRSFEKNVSAKELSSTVEPRVD